MGAEFGSIATASATLHIQLPCKFAREHRWYDSPREVTVSDLHAFDPKAV